MRKRKYDYLITYTLTDKDIQIDRRTGNQIDKQIDRRQTQADREFIVERYRHYTQILFCILNLVYCAFLFGRTVTRPSEDT